MLPQVVITVYVNNIPSETIWLTGKWIHKLFLISGTIVDEHLCHPKDYDFYLCAHAGIIVSFFFFFCIEPIYWLIVLFLNHVMDWTEHEYMSSLYELLLFFSIFMNLTRLKFQGTTRPTHYHVLVDENNFSVDELQNLTHSLCYTWV